jgi:hypothetical protein
MKASKLGGLLASFDPKDWRRFEAFIYSPYFNNNEDAKALFEALRTPDGVTALEKEAVFAKAFPGRPFDSRRMGYLMNYLLTLAEQFLATEGFGEATQQQHRYTLEAYSKRKLHKHYEFLLNKTKKLQSQEMASTQLLLQEYQLAEVEMVHFTNQKIRRSDPSVQHAFNYLNTFYYAHLLKYACAILSWKLVVKGHFELSPTTLQTIEALMSTPPESPLIQIYLHIYKTISTEGPEEESHHHFQMLEQLIKQHQEHIEQDEMREIYLYAINFCARRIRKGQHAYRKRVIELYEYSIAKGYLFENERLSHWTYTNVVKLMLLEKQYQKAVDFMHRHKEHLPTRFYNDAFHFNLAELHFQQGEYGEVLKLLQQLTFTDSHYNMGSRMLIIKTFYELDDLEPLLSNLASFTRLLMRNKKLSGAYQKTMLNFCKVLNQILRVQQDEEKKQKAAQRIADTELLAERSWLLEALDKQMTRD